MDIQNQTFYTGVVESRQDPLMLGRCQVRVVGLHTEDKNELPTADLPWAYPMQPITSAAMNGIGHAPLGPVEGTWVVVFFRDVERQQPIMMGSIGGIPQQDNNANIERDDDNYLLNLDDGDVVTTNSGVPVRITPEGTLVAGERGSMIGNNSRANLAAQVAEVNAALEATGGGAPNLSRAGAAGPALGAMSAYYNTTGSVYGTATNSAYDRQKAAINALGDGMSKYQNQISPGVQSIIQTQYATSQFVGQLTNGTSSVTNQITNTTNGFMALSNSVMSGVNTISNSTAGLQGSFLQVANSFGTFTNVRQFQVSGLPGFDNLAYFSDGRGGFTGALGGVNKVTGQINQGLQQVMGTVNQVVGTVQGVANTINSTAMAVQQQVQIAGAYGSIINQKFDLGLNADQQVVAGFAANIVLTAALKNPKVAAIANAMITTKRAFDTINSVIGKYTKTATGDFYYAPNSVLDKTRAISAYQLYANAASPLNVTPTNAGAALASAAEKVNSTAQDIAGKINDVTQKVNEFANKVGEISYDVGTVIGAGASAVGSWMIAADALAGKKKGGGQPEFGVGMGTGAGGANSISLNNVTAQFNKYDIITIVGLMQTNDLTKLRDGIGLFKSLSIPDAGINFNVNGVIGGQNYGVVSPIGELGKYQVNGEQLAALGYVNYLTNVKGERVYPSNFRLASNDVWTGKSGITSIQKFISTPAVQEKMMNELIAYNYDNLIRDGIITSSTSKEEIGGYLSIAHNTGLFAVKQFVNGENVVNSRGQSAYEAYQLGYGSITGGQATTIPGLQPPENPDPNQAAIGEVGADGRASLGRPTDKTETIGFRDPNRKYPYSDMLNEPDTNRLARNQFINRTVVSLKDARRDTKVVIAGGGATWDEPPSPYDSLYPFNHTYQSEAGHVIEVDDTPNRERMHWMHTRGTFEEWDANGTCVRKIVGDSYEILERNGFVHIRGECNLTVEGNANVMVKSNATIEVLGTTQGYFRNDFNAEVSGNMNLSVKESFQLKARDIHMETTGNSLTAVGLGADGFFRMKANGPYIASSEGDWNVTARNNIYQQSGDRISLNAGNNMYIYANQNMNLFSSLGAINAYATTNISLVSGVTMGLSAGGLMSFFTTGIMALTGTTSTNISAAGPLNLNGALVNLANPLTIPAIPVAPTPLTFAQSPAKPLDTLGPLVAIPAVPVLPSRNPNPLSGDLINALSLKIPSPRGTPVNPKYDVLSLPPRGLSKNQLFESPDEGDSTDFVNQQANRGKINPNERATNRESTEVPQREKQGKMPVCATFANVQDFPLSTKLSPNFYLGDFIPGGGSKYICQASTPQTLRDVPGGMTKQEIVCNLKGFAENIMERVITVVPKQDIIVTSGWRFPGSIGSVEANGSDHGKGGAVDIVLRNYGTDRRKHYDLIQKLQGVLPYDQLILEYAGSSVWIHIGFRSWTSSQRGMAFTVNNYTTYDRNKFVLLT